MNDFSTPRRMGGSAFVLLFLKNLKEYIALPVIFLGYKLYQDYGNKSPREIFLAVTAIFAATIAIALFVAFAGYYFKKFQIKGDKQLWVSVKEHDKHPLVEGAYAPHKKGIVLSAARHQRNLIRHTRDQHAGTRADPRRA